MLLSNSVQRGQLFFPLGWLKCPVTGWGLYAHTRPSTLPQAFSVASWSPHTPLPPSLGSRKRGGVCVLALRRLSVKVGTTEKNRQRAAPGKYCLLLRSSCSGCNPIVVNPPTKFSRMRRESSLCSPIAGRHGMAAAKCAFMEKCMRVSRTRSADNYTRGQAPQ